MNRIKIGLKLSDDDFQEAFAWKMADFFDIHLLSEDESGSEYPLIVSDCFKESEEKLIRLSYDRNQEGVYYLTNADEMKKIIIASYCSLYDDYAPMVKNEKGRIYSYLSGKGGTGCTTISYESARILAESEKVIYISFAYDPWVPELNWNGTEYVTNLIYELQEGRSGILERCICSDSRGVYHLRYLKPYNSLLVESSGVIMKLLALLTKHFEIVVIDMGSMVLPLSEKLLSISDSIYMISEENDCCNLERMKEKSFEIIYNRCEELRDGEVFAIPKLSKQELNAEKVLGSYLRRLYL